MPFEEWIGRRAQFNQQTYMISGTFDHQKALEMIKEKSIFVGLTNRFDESMMLLGDFASLQLSLQYEQRNVAETNAIANQLKDDLDAHELIRKVNEEDLQLFEHVQEEVFPAFIAAAGGEEILQQRIAERRQASVSPDKYSLGINRLYRNCVYKPLIKAYRLLPHESTPSSGVYSS